MNYKILTAIIFTLFILMTVNTVDALRIENSKTSNYEIDYRAVLVGISNYPGNQNDLSTPVLDVNAFNNVLSNGNNYYQTEILKDSSATKENILEKITWLKNNADENDVSIFYYCGHGTWRETKNHNREGDTHDKCLYVYDNIIRDDKLTDELSEINGKVVIILDCCKGAGFEEDLEYVVKPSSKVVLFTAHNENQNLFEIPLLKRGLLSFHLIGGFATDVDNNNQITIKDIYEASKDKYNQGKNAFYISYEKGLNIYCYPSYHENKDISLITDFSNQAPTIDSFECIKNRRGKTKFSTYLDDNSDDLDFFIYYGDNSGGWTSNHNTDEEIISEHEYDAAYNYRVSVIARDKYGSISNWKTEQIEVESKIKVFRIFSKFNFERFPLLKLLFPNNNQEVLVPL